MQFIPTEFDEVLIVEPIVHSDERGCFFETFREDSFAQAGISGPFVQDNHVVSGHGVLRGLHYQIERPQAKLVRVTQGEIYDVVVDLRHSSRTFGRWTAVGLSAANRRMLYVPIGLAHGYCVVSESAEVIYKCSEFYNPELERVLHWNDSDLTIRWPVAYPLVSEKDQRGQVLSQIPWFDAS